MKIRILAVISSFVMLFSVLSGCKASGTSSDKKESLVASASTAEQIKPVKYDPSKKVTVTITFSANEIGGNAVLEDIAVLYPSIKVNLEPMSNGDTKLLAMIAAGNGPDIIRASAFEELPSLVNRGLLMPLDSYINSTKSIDMKDLYDVNNLFRFDGLNVGKGLIYGIVKDWSFDSCIWMNKKAFSDAGIPLPSTTKPMTYKELADTARKLTVKQGDTIKRFGLVTVIPMVSLVENYLASTGNSIWSADFSTSTLQSAKTKEAINYWKDLQTSGVMSSTLYPSQDLSPVALTEDLAAMSIGGYWNIGQFRSTNTPSSLTDKLAVAPSPIFEGGRSVNAALSATGAGIFSGSKNPNEAYLVWEYLMVNKKTVAKRAELGWGIPAFKSEFSKLPKETNIEKQALEVTQYQLSHLDANPRANPYILYTGFTSLFDKNYNLVLYDKATMDEALKIIDSDLGYLIAEGKDISQ